MQPHGGDRIRAQGTRIVLLASFAKNWTPRTPAQGTHSEYPGTTVFCEDHYYEVVEATPADGERVRYVLEPWREEHTIRTFEHYDEASEARRKADYEAAKKQRRASAASRWSGMLLGHLPEPVQRRMQNELGVTPSRITILSCIPPVVILGICIFVTVDAMIRNVPSPVPTWLLLLAGFMTLESFIRFHIAMQQGRGLGSAIGTAVYVLYYSLSPNKAKLASPFGERGDKLFTLPPPDDIELRDKLTLKGPMLTLLSRAEQQLLIDRYGFDYREHAFGLTWIILVFSGIGAVTSYQSGARVAMLVALVIAGEQLLRLVQLQRGPAPSMFGVLVRPFVRDILR